jgi:hypothetical protein
LFDFAEPTKGPGEVVEEAGYAASIGRSSRLNSLFIFYPS